ncbi:MAG: type II toxin-antitoxin system prevent-host-death family antitoxin [Methylobacter sp.]
MQYPSQDNGKTGASVVYLFLEITLKKESIMRTITVATARSHLSTVLMEVEAGEEIVITRRGLAIARIVPEPSAAPAGFDLAELFAFVDAQPMHAGPDAGELLHHLRNEARY